MKLFALLRGKKTYLVAFVLAAVNLAVALEWITVEELNQVNAVLVALGLGALRAGVNKVE